MTDTPITTEVVTQAPVTLPKATTPDDLLAMYDEEGTAGPQAKAETPVPNATPMGKPKPTPEAKGEKTEESPLPEVPTFKAKHGDKEIDLPEEAVLKTQINGKEVEFKAKEAIQAYQKQQEFNRTMDKRVNDVTRKERVLKSEFDNIKVKANDVIKSAMTGDFWATIRSLAKIAAGSSQLDVVAFEKAMMDQIEAFKDPYTKMTPEQREEFFAKRRAKVYEDENKQLRQEKETREQVTSLEGRISQLQQEYGVPPQKFWETFKFIKEKLVGEGKVFAAEHDVQPEDVIQQHYYNTRSESVRNVAKKLNVTDPELISRFIDGAAENPDWTDADIEDVMNNSGVVGSAPREIVENLNRKVRRGNGQPQSNKVSSTKSEKAAGYDKDDMEFLYRNGPKGYTPIKYR